MPTWPLDALGALGDPTRRAIFELLVTRPRAVGELASELPVSRPAVSQHLKVLKDVELVTDTAGGTRRLYCINPHGVRALRDYLDRLWGDGDIEQLQRRIIELEQQAIDLRDQAAVSPEITARSSAR